MERQKRKFPLRYRQVPARQMVTPSNLNTEMKIPYGVCDECNDGKEKPLANKAKRLCLYHNKKRLQKEKEVRQAFRTETKKENGSISSRLVKARDAQWYSERIIYARSHPYCENCRKHIPTYIISRMNISHILGKGAYPEFRHHPKNFNVLCFDCHQQWEFGNRRAMEIYTANEKVVEQIRQGK